MTHSRSYTSATLNASAVKANLQVSKDSFTWWRTAWFVIFLLGVALRLLRLSWQPLWWDEGYSIYFATEPLPKMLWLTARDIHPPLYYTLLHFWFNLLGNTGPEAARLLSVLIGITTLPVMTWATSTLFPRQRGLALLATLLLVVNPIHLFYSQEIRMYGLALLLTLAATAFFWQMQKELAQEKQPYAIAFCYVITASLALLTLYYAGFLLLAHQIWAIWLNRHQWRRLSWSLVAALLVLLLQLPWWLYAFPQLFTYVADKVLADQDASLSLWNYLWRHWLAFFSGHLPATRAWLETTRQLVPGLIALLLTVAAIFAKWMRQQSAPRGLLSLILIPVIVGFVVNLYYPFFPEGGERLLLQILPYLLILLSLMASNLFSMRPAIAMSTVILPLVAATIGVFVYFTTPRYVEHDYRPIIAQVVEQGRANDTILAIFPWQVGYWRAYSPRTADGTLLPPQPTPVEQEILSWNDAFAKELDAALASGTLWFPMPLSFGSTLPREVEAYLQQHARNLENHWYSPATRLSSWVRLADTPEQHTINATYQSGMEPVVLVSGGAALTPVTSANTPLAVDLCWQPSRERSDLRTTLRLLDSEGYIWASRDLNPLAAHANGNAGDPCLESVALNIPVGLPPATYQLAVGVGLKESDQLLTPEGTTASGESAPLIPISSIEVTSPTDALSPYRLPIRQRLSKPLADQGIALLGYSGPEMDATLLAGDGVALTLFLQNSAIEPLARELYISILDRQGNGVDGWQDWPLVHYPTNNWHEGALAQVPVHFYIRPDLVAGNYTLIAGFIDPATGTKSEAATLNRVQIVRRATSFTPPNPQASVNPPALFGSHARLIGYNATHEGADLHLTLDWEIQQPLLPPHHIFIHLFDANNEWIAQSDGEPVTTGGRAPSGSWLPGEYLTTQHTITIPANAREPFAIQVGLYLPTTGARLPVSVEGAAASDHVTLPRSRLPTAP